MHEAILFSGFGGQGVMFAGQLLAYAGMDNGMDVTWIPSYGPEMRGGTAHCYVVISDSPIGAPIAKYPDVAVVFNNPSFERYEPMVKEGGLLVRNSSLINQSTARNDITEMAVPATSLADEVGNLRLANVITLAAMLTIHPIITVDQLKAAISLHIPSHRREMLDINYAAMDKGAEFASSVVTA